MVLHSIIYRSMVEWYEAWIGNLHISKQRLIRRTMAIQ